MVVPLLDSVAFRMDFVPSADFVPWVVDIARCFEKPQGPCFAKWIQWQRASRGLLLMASHLAFL